ncbi:MAG: L-serine ammonia-lyase, iron-sulfur-dependent, subunit beta [Christensenellales bacterium]
MGSAAAMAAAAAVEIAGGTPAQALAAASSALMSLMGLVCDPVGGLVEVPCVYRNVGASGIAFTAADMALSGIRCPIEPDEVILAMKEVGDALPTSLRETGEGGCAACESICKRLHHKE